MYLIHGLVTNIATQNVIIQKKSSLVVQSSHWSSSSSSLAALPKWVSIASGWSLPNGWLWMSLLFLPHKRRHACQWECPSRTSQRRWLSEWINVIQSNKKRGRLGGVIKRSYWCLVFIVYARSCFNPCQTWLEQDRPGMDRQRGTGSSVCHSRCGRWPGLVVVQAWTKSEMLWFWKKP